MALIERQPLSPVAPDASPRVEPFLPGTTIGRYRIIALAGSGAMGDVYRGNDRVLDRDVALKILPSNLVHDRDRVHRFSQEARAASALSHPHIVTIYEVGHARPSLDVQPINGGRASRRPTVHYIAMEYIDGKTLRESTDANLTLRRRVEVMAEVADGLTKAHSAGIIHRDLKPENIIIAREGYAKIVDFGLAKLIDSDGWSPIGADSPTVALTQKGEILGTPGYMAPEQVTGGTIDARTDIFSFGCILYELISGRQPFEGDSFLDTMHKIVHDAPPRLTTIAPDVPPELADVAEKCLAKKRAERYETIHDAALDLRRWLYGDVASGSGARRRPATPRRRVIAAALAGALLLGGGGYVAHRKLAAARTSAEEHTIARVTSSGRVVLATIAGDGRYLAYVLSDGKGQSLWIEQTETRSRLQIAAPAEAHYAGLAFSRDGNYLYFSRYDSYPFGALFRVPILGGKPETIVRDVDSRPAFSPDGKVMAYIRDDYNKAISTLFVANADGSGERALATSRIPYRLFSPAWSPEDNKIAVAEETKLIEITYPTGERREIATQQHFQWFRGLNWTPDHSLVAAAATEGAGDRVRLWRIDPKSGECRAITDELSNVYAPVITADGSAIAALQVVRHGSLFEIDENSNVKQLANAAGYAHGVAWLGERVFYSSSADGNPDLWTIDTRGGEATRITNETPIDTTPKATPDGSLVLYRSGNGLHWTIWSMRPDGSERRALTNGPTDGDFAISPDSKTLAWASLDDASNEWVLWTMPLAGGPHRRLTSRKSMLDQLRFTPDGQSILFTGYEDTRCAIFRISASGSAATLLTMKPASAAEVSPDGKTLAMAYGMDGKKNAPLALISLADPSHVEEIDLKGGGYRWRNAKSVSFVREDDGASNLWLKTLGGGAPQRLTNFTEGSVTDYAWSDDGKRAVVAHVVDMVDVVLIRNGK